MTQLPLIQLVTIAFTLWFGTYLLARHDQKVGMRFAGLGLVAYAVGLAGDALIVSMNDPVLLEQAVWFRRAWVILPAICWVGAIQQLLPIEARADLPGRPIGLIFLATIFFGLAVATIILPQNILATDVVFLAISVDVILLGYGISALDAFEDGEAFFPDFLRAFLGAGLVTLILGGQVAVFMTITNNVTPATLLLLMTIIATGIVLQTFTDNIQQGLDYLIFGRTSAAKERADLRAVSQAIPRFDDSLDINTLPEKEFNRLTRRALSNMGNLTKLASSPLTHLPIIHQRLADKEQSTGTLDRANELKLVLIDSINRLKPPIDEAFGTSDEWRYYNALYFPYVVGIKPFSRRNLVDNEDTLLREVLDWFQVYVPERTLYNWQSAGAKLIAQDLREQVYAIVPPTPTEIAYQT
jgi:hypothetical protein